MSSYLTMLLDSDSEFPSLPIPSISSLIRQANYHNILGAAVRLAMIGIFAAGVRRAFKYLSAKIGRGELHQNFSHLLVKLTLPSALFPTAYIPYSDQSYLWVMA